ncbi:RNA polymerase sigma factor [Oleiharenicola lentus]|uniref:RNA polymerase sigma factor n=1 Tax=Oleiharenicola lentus TaxID=2508720 RepID=UPI003F6749D4
MSSVSSTPAGDESTDTSAEADQRDALLAQRGDAAALDALVKRHYEGVSRLLWKFARESSELEDLVQETFLRLVKHLHTWRAEKPFAHWLRRIAANTGRDYYRRQAVRRRWRVEPAVSRFGDSAEAPEIEAIDPAMDPAARAAADEVKEILATLPPDDRAVLTLHHLEGWDLATIAEQFGWTVTATKLRAWRARARLRALL